MYASIEKSKYCYLFQLYMDGWMESPGGNYIDVFMATLGISANDIGQVYYRSSTDNAILVRAAIAVGGPAFAATYVFIVTWHKVTSPGGSNTSPVSLLLCMYLLCNTTFCHTTTSHPGNISADWSSNVFNNLT